MIDRDFIALTIAWSRTATTEQRTRAARFLGVLSAEPESSESARELHERCERERLFEEAQLAPGPDLDRRLREPA